MFNFSAMALLLWPFAHKVSILFFSLVFGLFISFVLVSLSDVKVVKIGRVHYFQHFTRLAIIDFQFVFNHLSI